MHLGIVIAYYNRHKYLLELADSFAEIPDHLLDSEQFKVEFFWVDDGSDEQILRAKDLPHKVRVRSTLLQVPHAGRPARARNFGAKTAKNCTHLMFMDSDDRLVADQFEELLRDIVKHPEVDAFSVNFRFISRAGRPIKPFGRYVQYPWYDPRPTLWNIAGYRKAMLSKNRITNPSPIRRDAFLRLGGYSEDITVEDYEFWTRAVFSGAKIRPVRHVVFENRIHDEARSFDKRKEIHDVLDFIKHPRFKNSIGLGATSRMQQIWATRLIAPNAEVPSLASVIVKNQPEV